ncbi:MAG: hypothetical protein U5J83_01135 [Bryobacterales bacterium]|nr:hypothetical protein [Bryobacterales bacterium]
MRRKSPITERYDRLNARLPDSTTPNPVEAQAKANYANRPESRNCPASEFSALGGLTFVNANGVSANPFSTETNNFLPRIGFSWSVCQSTVLRGGYGVFYNLVGINTHHRTASGLLPIDAHPGFPRQRVNLPHHHGESASRTGSFLPRGASGGLSTNLGQGFTVYPEKRLNGYAQRFSFGLQQQVGQLLLEATYLGNRGTRLLVPTGASTTRPTSTSAPALCVTTTTINYLSQALPKPVPRDRPHLWG